MASCPNCDNKHYEFGAACQCCGYWEPERYDVPLSEGLDPDNQKAMHELDKAGDIYGWVGFHHSHTE